MNPDDTLPSPSVDALLAGHALGDLDASERQQLATLLHQNPALRQRLEEFQTTLELLPLALPATAAPPQRLRQRLLQKLGTSQGGAADQQHGGPQRRLGLGPLAPGGWRRRAGDAGMGWLVPAMLGMALLVVGAQLQQTRQQLVQLQQQVQVVAAQSSPTRRMPLIAVEPGLGASGEVMVTGNPTHNVLMLNGLPPPPPHHVYRLWATVDGQKVGCVAFVPTAQGHVAMLIPPTPTSLAKSVSVSVEVNASGAEPSGPMVLTSSL